MAKNKILFLISFMLLLTSCADTWSSVKRGVTGEKDKSIDEFLVKKKDPLILPPDYESLPTPAEREEAVTEISSFEKKLDTESEETFSSSNTTEQSILKQIQRQ